MKTVLIALIILGSLALVTPLADACSPCGGSCHVTYDTVGWIVLPDGSGYPIQEPRVECYY